MGDDDRDDDVDDVDDARSLMGISTQDGFWTCERMYACVILDCGVSKPLLAGI